MPVETVEDGLDLVLFGDLDEEGGAELTTPRQEGIVDVELGLPAGIIGDPLDPAHLLDLEEQGVAVLEDEERRWPMDTRRQSLSSTDSAVGCASVPRSTSRTSRRGPVRRSPRAPEGPRPNF